MGASRENPAFAEKNSKSLRVNLWEEAFIHERIANKYLTWAWQMDAEAGEGLTRQQFTRYYFMRLGMISTASFSTPNIPASLQVKQSYLPCDWN